MEYTAGNVYKAIDMLAPFGGCMAWDNVGLLVGEPDSAVTGILVTLDVTPAAVAQALEMRMNCIVSPHYFSPAKAHQRAGCGGAVPGQWHLSHQRAHQLRLCAAWGELRPGANAGTAEYPALWPGR